MRIKEIIHAGILFTASLWNLTGVASDNDLALKTLMFEHAQALKDRRDDNDHFESSLTVLAHQNHRESQFTLGILLFAGTIKPTIAIDWLSKADKNGCSGATGILGQLYLAGKHVPKDEAKGRNLLQFAAKQGDFGAQIALGTMYLQKNNITDSYSWFYQASLLDKPIAIQSKMRLYELENKLSESDKKSAQQEAEKRIKENGGLKYYYCAHSIPM